jgi:lysozyme
MKRRQKTIFRFLILLTFIGLLFHFHKSVIRLGYKAYRELHTINYPVNTIPGRIDVPGNYTVHGIDVSKWQSNVNWENLHALNIEDDTLQMTFAFIKATEGVFWEDPMFDDNWENAKRAKITRGAYHYFKPNLSATLQSKNFIGSVKLKAGDLPPVLDIEETGNKSKKELVKSLKTYLGEIETHYQCKPIIYSNISFIETYLAGDFKDYQFWIANYYKDKLVASPQIKWMFWQYYDRGKISGCNECVDMNVFKGSRAEFNKILIQ